MLGAHCGGMSHRLLAWHSHGQEQGSRCWRECWACGGASRWSLCECSRHRSCRLCHTMQRGAKVAGSLATGVTGKVQYGTKATGSPRNGSSRQGYHQACRWTPGLYSNCRPGCLAVVSPPSIRHSRQLKLSRPHHVSYRPRRRLPVPRYPHFVCHSMLRTDISLNNASAYASPVPPVSNVKTTASPAGFCGVPTAHLPPNVSCVKSCHHLYLCQPPPNVACQTYWR